MACIVKVGNKFENLSGYNTFITDKEPNSEYFKISKFADTFTAGKNLFLIEGSECLKESTEIRMEMVDAEGNTLYIEPGRGVPDYYEGNSVVLSTHVYETTPVGPAKITILGELKDYFDEDGIKRPIPDEWKGAYNVKWEKNFFINRNENNKTPVIFYKRPQITIEEVESTILSQTIPTTTQTGSIIGLAENPPKGTDLTTWRAGTLYRFEKTAGDGFKSAMDEQTIRIPSIGYEGRVKEVINSNVILVDKPFFNSENLVVDSGSVDSPFEYSITYEDFASRTSTESAVTASFGRITLKDLDTFTGNVDKLKIYKKSRSDVGDFKFQDEVKIVNGNLLRDELVPGSELDGGFGTLTQPNIDRYWTTSSLQISGSDTSISFDDDLLYESIRIEIPSSSQQTESLDLITNNEFNLFADTDYELNFKTLVSGSFTDTIPGKVTVVSESYQRTFYYKYDESKLKTFNPTYISQSSYSGIESPNSQSVNLTKPFVYDNSRVDFYNTPQNSTGSVYTSIPSGYAYTHSHDTTLTFDTTSGDWGTNSRVQTDSFNKTNIVARSGSFCGEFNLVVWLDSGSFTLPTGGSPTDVRTIVETYDSGSTRIALFGLQNIGTDAKFYYKHSTTELDELQSLRTSTEYSLESIDTNDYNDNSVVSTWDTGSQTIIDYNDGGYHYVHIDYRTLRSVEPLNAELINVKRLDSLDGDILYGTTYEINSMNFDTGDITFSHNSTDGTLSGVVSLVDGQAVLTIGSDTTTGYIVELDFEQGFMVFTGELDFTELTPAQRSYDLYDLFDLSGSNWSSTGSTDLYVPRVPPRAGDYLYTEDGYPYSSTEFSDRNFLTTEFTSPSSSEDNFSNPLQIPYIFRNDDDIIENVYVEESDQIYVVSSVSSSSDVNNTEYIYDQSVQFTGWFYTGSFSSSVYVDDTLHGDTYKTSLDTYNTLITAKTPISTTNGDFNIVLLTDSGSSQLPTSTGSVDFQLEYYQSSSAYRAVMALRNVDTDAMLFYNSSSVSQSVLESYSGSTNIILDSIDSSDFTSTQTWFLSTGSQAIFDIGSGSNHFIYIDYRSNRTSEPLNADIHEVTAISQIGTNDFSSLLAREIFPLSGSRTITGSVTSTDYYTSQVPLVAGNTLYNSTEYPFIPATVTDSTYISDDVDINTDVTIPDTQFEIPYVFNTVDGKVENVFVKRFDNIFTASSENGTGTTAYSEPPYFVSRSLKEPDTDVPKTLTAFITGSYPSGSENIPFRETLVTLTANENYATRQQIQHLFTMPFSGSGNLGFSTRGDGWQISNIDLKAAQDASFSPKVFNLLDEQDRNLPVETFDYRFELYDVNNNYIPIELKASKEFRGGNKVSTDTVKILTFESDRTAFKFYSGSLANPRFQQARFNFSKTAPLTSSILFGSSAYDKNGNYIEPSSYTGDYPGGLTNVTATSALLTVGNFSGSDSTFEVSSIVYTASCQDRIEYETIFRLEDGQPYADLIVNNDRSIVSFKQSNSNVDPSTQVSTITVKRKNLASNTETITANSSSVVGSAPPLTLLSDNPTTGVATYFLSGSSMDLASGSLRYEFTASDEFSQEVGDFTTITPISFIGGIVLYLTNERGVLPAFASGIIPSSSYTNTSGSTQLYVEGDEVSFDNSLSNNTYRITGITGSGITPNETNPTTNEYGGVAGTMLSESSSLQINIEYKDSQGQSYYFGRQANFSIVKEGEPGQPGLEGSNGPGLVMTGQWSNTRDYIRTTGSLARADAVISGSEFYLAISSSGPSHGGAVNPSDSTTWEALGTASRFVAAELAVFAESYVQNTLNVGTNNSGNTSAANITIAGGTDAPYISMGQGATTGTQGYNVGDGIFLGFNGNNDNTASFSLENGLTGNELLWDGETLSIRGDITVTNNEDFITPTDTGSMLSGFVSNDSTESLENPTEYSFGSVFSLASASAVTGLNLTSDYLGYYDGSTFDSYMDSSGNFYLGGESGALQWDGSNLVISGSIAIVNPNDIDISTLNNDSGFTDDTVANQATASAAEASASAAEASSTATTALTSAQESGSVDPTTRRVTKNASPSGAGLYLGANNLGYYDSSDWKAYLSSSGEFYLGSTSDSSYLEWNGSNLSIAGSITITAGATKTKLDGLDAATGSLEGRADATDTKFTNVGTFSGSVDTKFGDLENTTASIDTKFDTLETNSGSWVNPTTYAFGGASSAFALRSETAAEGLNLNSDYFGYHDGTTFQTYMANNGDFFLNGTNGSLAWNSEQDLLQIKGNLEATNLTATNTGLIGGFTIGATTLNNGGDILLSAGSSTENARINLGGVINIENKTTLSPTTTLSTPTVSGALSKNSSDTTATGATGTIQPSYSNTNGVTSTDASPPSFQTTSSGYANQSATISGTISPPTLTGGTSAFYKSEITGQFSSVYMHRVQAKINVILQKSTSGTGSWTDVNTWSYTFTNTSTTSTLTAGTSSQNWSISFTLENSMYYRIISKTDNIDTFTFVQYAGTGSTAISARFNVGTISNPTLSVVGSTDAAYSELTKGGFQVVTTSTKYVKIPTAATGDSLEVGGDISATGNITAYSTSDLRLKKNIKLIPDALDKVKEINGVTFEWKDGFSDIHSFKGDDIGVIAQEIEYILPHVGVVKQNENTGYRGVRYEKLTPLLIEAIKDLSKQVNRLEKEIKQLKG